MRPAKGGLNASGHTRDTLRVVLITLFFCAVFFVLLEAAMHKQLSHDEHMYVSSGILLHAGKLPYADYPYFQMPLLTLVYGAIMWDGGYLLLTARLFNTICAFLTCVALFFGVLRLLRASSFLWASVIAAGAVVLFISSPEFIYTSGLAWNHDLPVLLTLCALLLAITREAEPTGNGRAFMTGLLLGLATSARSLFLAAALPALVFVAFVPSSAGWLRRCVTLGLGLLVGLLPALLLFLINPPAFIFGNLTYHQLNEEYWRQIGYDRAMTLGGKLKYLYDVVSAEPFNWLVLLGCVVVIVLAAWSALPRHKIAALALGGAVVLLLLVANLVPTPTWLQYFHAPYAFLCVTLACGVAYLATTRWRLVGLVIFLLVVTVGAITALHSYWSLALPLSVQSWVPVQVHDTAMQIRKAVLRGTVATLSPLYALEGGLSTYPELEAGPFAMRIAPFVSQPDRQSLKLFTPQDLLNTLSGKPPDALLTGSEGGLEDPLVQFAKEHKYRETKIGNGLSLWVVPR